MLAIETVCCKIVNLASTMQHAILVVLLLFFKSGHSYSERHNSALQRWVLICDYHSVNAPWKYNKFEEMLVSINQSLCCSEGNLLWKSFLRLYNQIWVWVFSDSLGLKCFI